MLSLKIGGVASDRSKAPLLGACVSSSPAARAFIYPFIRPRTVFSTTFHDQPQRS